MKRRYNPLRAKLDLTQQELAHFLQLPLSTVAICESGKRTWPTKGLLRLAQLELACVAAENLPVSETSPVPELLEVTGKLKGRMKECLETAGLLQKMLDSMKTILPLLKTKEKTLQLLSEPGTSGFYQGWIELQLYKIGKPRAENSPAKQIMLEHQVNTLRAEAAAAAATIERLEQQMEEERLNTAGEEGIEAALPHEPVETTFPIHTVFLSKIEMPALKKQDTLEPSGPKAFVEPLAFDLNIKRNYDRNRYHRTTTTGSTPRSRLLQRNPSRRIFHQQPRQQTTERQYPVRSRSIAGIFSPPQDADKPLPR